MDEKSKRSSFGMAEAAEDACAGVPEESQYDAVFGEITEDGPNYRSVSTPMLCFPAVCPS